MQKYVETKPGSYGETWLRGKAESVPVNRMGCILYFPCALLYRSYKIQFPSSVEFASAAQLKFIPKSANGPLYRECAESFKLKSCVGKGEIWCGLCVDLPPFDFYLFKCWM